MVKQIVSKAVGIDLGTTNSKVAVMNPTDTEIVIHQDPITKSETTPSYVWVNPATGEVVVGRKALVHMGSIPPPIRLVKRLMGQQTKVILTGEELAPQEVSAYILREMKRQIEEYVARFSTENTTYAVDRAIVTVPAYFDQNRITATRRAGEIAGFEVLELLHEPTASTLYYCWKHNIQNGVFLVYDFGGGALDVTVLRYTEGTFEVLGISGNVCLGGDDIDRVIAENLQERLIKDGYALELDLKNDHEDKIRFDRLKFLAEGVKKALSTLSEYLLIDTASLKDKEGKPVKIETIFERFEIEALIRPIVEQTIPYCFDALEQAEKKAGIKLADVDAVILAGGSTHIPLVREIVRQNLCSPLSEHVVDRRARQQRANCEAPVYDKVDASVALGAAIRAAATGGLVLYNPEKTVRVYFSGIGVTDRKETFAGGKVTALDPNLDLTGGYIRLSIPDIGYTDECDLPEGGAFHFKSIPLQPSAASLLTFEVLDRDGSLIAAVDRQIKQSEETVSRVSACASTAVLSKGISLEVEREGKPVLKELIKALTPLPIKAVFYFPHKGGTEIILPIYRGKTKIQEIKVKLPSSLPEGTPVELDIEADRHSFLTVKVRISETVFEAEIEQLPEREMPTREKVQSLERSFREVLDFLPAGRRNVEEAEYKMTKKSFEAAAKSGEKEKAINYFEEMEALVAELSQVAGPVQPPKEFFDAAVRKCYELNQWMARAAAKEGVLYDDIEMAKQIDAQRVQGEKAFEAGNQKAYSDAIMMLENIQGYIIQFARENDLIKVPQMSKTEKAQLLVRTAEEEAAEIAEKAERCSREDLKDEANQIKNKLNELKAEIQTNPDGVSEKASQIRLRLEQMNNELMGISRGTEGPKHVADHLSDKPVGGSEVPGNIVDNVHFSVTSPSQVCTGASFIVDIWAHLGGQRDKIVQLAQKASPGVQISVKSKGPVSVTRGTVLTVRLRIDELVVENYEDTILWNNEIGNANFRVIVPPDVSLGSKTGLATIHANGIQIARIYFVIQVDKTTSVTEKISTQLQQHRQAFASYASEDRDYVLRCVQGIQKVAPQIDVFIDVVSLRSGQYWEKELWKIIPSKDVFYLFWSRNAAKSEWVEKEWRCALKTRGLDFIDPVPLEAPEQAPPPPELASKHFNDWVLAYMHGKSR